MAPPDLKLEPGTLLDDRFCVQGRLGDGGMGIVIAAEHRALRQTVAIKLMRPEFCNSPDIVERFLREARAAAKLRSEHVAHVMDVDVLESGIPYFVMEYSPGVDLAKHLDRHGPLPVDQVLEYTLQALEAIAEAHRAGIVHRDLKPANLFLTTREDDSPMIKVLDFGISKSTEVGVTSKLTKEGSMLGSPVYMSPEQIRDASSVDARTDIWSIGVLAYELLSGKPPFRGPSAQAVIASICTDEPRPLPPRVPPELSRILSKCLAKRAEDRFQTVSELAVALAPLSNDPACRLSVGRILRVRSNPPPAWASAPQKESALNTARGYELRAPRIPQPFALSSPDSTQVEPTPVSLPPDECDTRDERPRVLMAKRKFIGSAVAGMLTALLVGTAIWRLDLHPLRGGSSPASNSNELRPTLATATGHLEAPVDAVSASARVSGQQDAPVGSETLATPKPVLAHKPTPPKNQTTKPRKVDAVDDITKPRKVDAVDDIGLLTHDQGEASPSALPAMKSKKELRTLDPDNPF